MRLSRPQGTPSTRRAAIGFDLVPPPSRRAGMVTELRALAPDLVELVVTLSRPLAYLPGQHASVAFAGFPARDYSPTLRLDGCTELNEWAFLIRREPRGLVSSQIGHRIRPGHLVRVRGPHGAAFHRRGEGRLVLVAAGTGFAPIWAVARAARYTEPGREVILVVGAREADRPCLCPALDWLRGTGAAGITLVGEGDGGPAAVLPPLLRSDTVHAAGDPATVAAVARLAAEAGALCHAEPFLPAARRASRPVTFTDILRQRLRPPAAVPAEEVEKPAASGPRAENAS